jgi:hypothetical protein
MLELIVILFLFVLKTTSPTLFWIYANPYLPMMSIFFMAKKTFIHSFVVIFTVLLLNIAFTDNYLFILINYSLILPLFFILPDSFFKNSFFKGLSQGTLVILIFYIFRQIFFPVTFLYLLLTILFTEGLLLILLPLAGLAKWHA